MPNWDTTAWASSHTTLKFRITFYVMSILILLAGIGGYVIRPKDVLPEVDIPVITVVWTYTGMDTPEMDKRVTTYSAFALSNNVNGIRNMESETLQGVTMTRIYFQPDVSIDLALSQVTAATNSVRAALPPPASTRRSSCDFPPRPFRSSSWHSVPPGTAVARGGITTSMPSPCCAIV